MESRILEAPIWKSMNLINVRVNLSTVPWSNVINVSLDVEELLT